MADAPESCGTLYWDPLVKPFDPEEEGTFTSVSDMNSAGTVVSAAYVVTAAAATVAAAAALVL